MSFPIVTILMCVYNGEEFLREAIESMLMQTFSQFEFLIINDASKDNSGKIILSYPDPRIRVIDNEINIGLTRSLNKGIALSKGKYIARMDADDISLPGRLQKQVEFMEAHPEAGVVGTWILFTDTEETFCPPADYEDVKIQLFKNNSLAHPSVMMRNDMFQKFQLSYNEKLQYAQDYELWVQCCRYFKVYNIPEVLVRYRRHSGQISSEKKILQDAAADEARLIQLGYLKLQPDEKEKDLHLYLLNGKITSEIKLDEVMKWTERLKAANGEVKYFQPVKFNLTINHLRKSTVNLFLNYTGYNLDTLKKYFSSRWKKYSGFHTYDISKFIFKCLVRWKPGA
ncbi:MAG: glycosyltransferase [Bacteroidota bacterium]